MLSAASQTVSNIRNHHQARSNTAASEQPADNFASLVDNNLVAADQSAAPATKPAAVKTPAASQNTAPPAKGDNTDAQSDALPDSQPLGLSPNEPVIVAGAEAKAATLPAPIATSTEKTSAETTPTDDIKAADTDSATSDVAVATPVPVEQMPAVPVVSPANVTTAPSPATPPVISQDVMPAVEVVDSTSSIAAVPGAADLPTATQTTSDAPEAPTTASDTQTAMSKEIAPQPSSTFLPAAATAAPEPAVAATLASQADTAAIIDSFGQGQTKTSGKAATTTAPSQVSAKSATSDGQTFTIGSDAENSVAPKSVTTITTAPASNQSQDTAAPTVDGPKDTATQPSSVASDKAAHTTKKNAEPNIAALPASDSAQPSATTTIVTHHSLLTGVTTLQSTTITTTDVGNLPTTVSVSVATTAAVPLGALGVEIASNLQSGNSRFEIRLDPADLGRIDVRLDVDKDGRVTSHLAVEKPATLDILRREAPQLERALNDAGFKTSGDGLQFSLRDRSSGGNDHDGARRGAQRLVISEDEAPARESAGRSYGRLSGISGGLDIRV